MGGLRHSSWDIWIELHEAATRKAAMHRHNCLESKHSKHDSEIDSTQEDKQHSNNKGASYGLSLPTFFV